MVAENQPMQFEFSCAWKLHTIQRVKLFWWKILWNGLLVKKQWLIHRGLLLPHVGNRDLCLIIEDIPHVILLCQVASQTWASPKSFLNITCPFQALMDLMYSCHLCLNLQWRVVAGYYG